MAGLRPATGKLNHPDVFMKRFALLGAVLFVLLGATSSSAVAASSSCSTYNPQNCSSKTTTTSTNTSPTTTSTTTTTATGTTTTTSTLPFTGADVGLLVLGGALLCLGGFGIRQLSRRFE